MMFRIFEIMWDHSASTNVDSLPKELVMDVRKSSDTTAMRFEVMDTLDAEYNSRVDDFKMEEI